MNPLPIEEIEQDHQASLRDIEYLTQAAEGIEAFMRNPCGENRTHLKTDLYKWQGLLAEAKRLHEHIRNVAKEQHGVTLP